MKKLLLALAFCLASSASWAQCTGVFPANTLCGNLGASPAPPAAFSAAGTVVGPSASTSGFFATWGNNLGTLLSSITSVTTSQSVTWTASQSFTGINSESNTTISSAAITSTFNFLKTSITSIVQPANSYTFSGNNTFSGTTSFSGKFVVPSTGTISLFNPLAVNQGGTGHTSLFVPTTQVFTTGTSLTYTIPSNPSPTYIVVEECGGGAGGGAAATNNGTNGGYTIFASWSAFGGTGGPNGGAETIGGAGGTGGVNGTIGTQIIRQAGGRGMPSQNGANGGSASGGVSFLGGTSTTSAAAQANGCGGGAGGGNLPTFGGGGGAGEYARFQINAPTAPIVYTVGTSGAGGPAGTTAGQAGGGGIIIVREYYQ